MKHINKSQIKIKYITEEEILENLKLLNLIIKEGHFLALRREISEHEAHEFFNFWVESELSIYLVAKYQGKIIGHISNRPREEDRLNHVGSLGYLVHPDYRKLGIGSILIEEILKLSPERGFEIITAEISDDNIASINLLKKFKSKGLIYLPTSSYPEMDEWTMEPQEFLYYKELKYRFKKYLLDFYSITNVIKYR